MFFESKRVRRNPYNPTPYPPEKPIRLDEARLDAWAHALGQQRDGTERASALRDRLAARLFRGILAGGGKALAGKAVPEAAGMADSGRSGLGDSGSSAYVWLVEAESNPAERDEGAFHEPVNLNEGKAAAKASQD